MTPNMIKTAFNIVFQTQVKEEGTDENNLWTGGKESLGARNQLFLKEESNTF